MPRCQDEKMPRCHKTIKYFFTEKLTALGMFRGILEEEKNHDYIEYVKVTEDADEHVDEKPLSIKQKLKPEN